MFPRVIGRPDKSVGNCGDNNALRFAAGFHLRTHRFPSFLGARQTLAQFDERGAQKCVAGVDQAAVSDLFPAGGVARREATVVGELLAILEVCSRGVGNVS